MNISDDIRHANVVENGNCDFNVSNNTCLILAAWGSQP